MYRFGECFINLNGETNYTLSYLVTDADSLIPGLYQFMNRFYILHFALKKDTVLLLISWIAMNSAKLLIAAASK